MDNPLNSFRNLSLLKKGERALITGIHAPDGTRQRLQSMGLRTGHEAEVIRCPRLGQGLRDRSWPSRGQRIGGAYRIG